MRVLAGGQRFQAGQRLGQREIRQVVLAKKIEEFRAQTDAGVEFGIGAGDVGAELDQVFGIAISGERAADFAGGLLLRGARRWRCVRRLTEWRMSMAG